MNKTAIIGVITLIIIIPGFMIAPLILQSVRQSSVKFPKTNVIDYQVDVNLRNALVENGATFMTLGYNSMCENCLEQKSFLEQVAKEFEHHVSQGKDTIYDLYLEEIVDANATVPKLALESSLGYKELTNATQDDIFSGLCDLLTSPPIICAAR